MGYTESEARKFIDRIAPMMREEATKRNYPIVSTAISQAIIEGAAGTSTLAKKPNFNHFGMKAGSTWHGKTVRLRTKEEYKHGVLTEIYADFRAYDSDLEGIKGYYDFLKYKRYENLHYAKDYRQYAEYLKKDGWATSSKYRDTLIKTVEKYGLIQWDNMEVVYYPRYTGGSGSIVMALDTLGIDSSFGFRETIYNANYSDKYRGSEVQNNNLLILLKNGKLIMP